MDIISILMVLAAVFGVSLFVSQPFNTTRRAPQADAAVSDERQSLAAEHRRLLDALQELDNDYAEGKLPEADYTAQRTSLLQAGAIVLKTLDEMK